MEGIDFSHVRFGLKFVSGIENMQFGRAHIFHI